jgi:hypothetical protein
VQHVTNEKKGYVLEALDTKNTEEGRGVQHAADKKMLHTWSFRHKKHMIHHQRPTHAQAKKFKLKCFLRNLKS